jgi:hypothetical protein
VVAGDFYADGKCVARFEAQGRFYGALDCKLRFSALFSRWVNLWRSYGASG